jgi:hypothetical protein
VPRKIEDHRIDLAIRLLADAAGSGLGDPQRVKDALRDLFTWTPEHPPEQFDELRGSVEDALERAASTAVLEERKLDPPRALTDKELTRIARRHGVNEKGLMAHYKVVRTDPDFHPDPQGDWEVPFFTETYLYTLLGKSDARSLLGRMRVLCEALGFNSTEQAELYEHADREPLKLLFVDGTLRGTTVACRDYDSARELQHPLEWSTGLHTRVIRLSDNVAEQLAKADVELAELQMRRGY